MPGIGILLSILRCRICLELTGGFLAIGALIFAYKIHVRDLVNKKVDQENQAALYKSIEDYANRIDQLQQSDIKAVQKAQQTEARIFKHDITKDVAAHPDITIKRINNWSDRMLDSIQAATAQTTPAPRAP